MTDDRCTGLALMNVHQDMKINTDMILEKFALANRRISL